MVASTRFSDVALMIKFTLSAEDTEERAIVWRKGARITSHINGPHRLVEVVSLWWCSRNPLSQNDPFFELSVICFVFK